MKANVKTFLKELYEIDPDLATHEDELVPLIEQMLASDPGIAPDKDFVQTLRMQLQSHAATLSADEAPSRFQGLFYAFGGAVAVAVLLPMAYYAFPKDSKPAGVQTPLFTYKVEDAGREAFGELATTQVNPVNPTVSARPQSGGGGPAMGMGGGGGIISPMPADAPANTATMDMKIMPYPMTQFQYSFSGSIEGLKDTVDVYKKNTSGKSMSLSSLLGSFNLGTVDLSSFGGATMDSISFSQHQPFGYQVFVNFFDGSVSLNQLWDQWPQSKCQTEQCYRNEAVKIDDIKADSEMISIATKFLKDHAIDLDHYGAPEVDNSWRREYDRSTDKSTVYIPDVVRVIFPLLINDQAVYDQGGGKSGISVGVSVKHNRVSDVWGITDRSYQKSQYAGVTDQAEVMKYLNTQNRFAIDSMPRDMKVNTVNVTLGEPTISYAVFYRYTTGVNDELLVPSLVFPVMNATGNTPEYTYYPSKVIVPLSKEILEQQGGNGVPMPLMDNIRM